MDSTPCTNAHCAEDSHETDTYLDLFGLERDFPLYAPDREYDGDPPQYRMHPIAGFTPNIDVDHCGIGNTLKHYIGHEEMLEAAIEYRRPGCEIWFDADVPGRPAPRDEPPLTVAQVADLTRERPDLADVPFAEPLVFLAQNDMRGNFWGRAVAAGWVPTRQDLELLINARAELDLDSRGGADRA